MRAVPGSSWGREKIKTFEAVYSQLVTEGNSPTPIVLGGDFNAPKKESPDGQIIPFAGSKVSSDYEDLKLRWREAELKILKGLAEEGIYDAYRFVNGFDDTEVYSWQSKRFDHIFVSKELKPKSSFYLKSTNQQKVICLDSNKNLLTIRMWPSLKEKILNGLLKLGPIRKQIRHLTLMSLI